MVQAFAKTLLTNQRNEKNSKMRYAIGGWKMVDFNSKEDEVV